MRLFLNVLGIRQRRALIQLGPVVWKRGFYLGGGTAIALQLGHRRSVDLDWFTSERSLDPLGLAEQIRDQGLPLVTDSTAPGTLHGRLFGVRVSFLAYPYAVLKPPRPSPIAKCRLASLDDLAAMKLSALGQRGAKKDFVDLYALCRKHATLSTLLRSYRRRFQTTDIAHVLYSLAYFEDADRERLPRMMWQVTWPTIKRAVRSWVAELGAATNRRAP